MINSDDGQRICYHTHGQRQKWIHQDARCLSKNPTSFVVIDYDKGYIQRIDELSHSYIQILNSKKMVYDTETPTLYTVLQTMELPRRLQKMTNDNNRRRKVDSWKSFTIFLGVKVVSS